MQVQYEQQSEHIKTITLTKPDGEARCAHDVMVKFDMIKRARLTTEDKQYLNIIRGDIYDACNGTDIEEIYVITEWSDYAFDECLEMVEDYIYDTNRADDSYINEGYFINPETTAIFFVVGTDYPFAWQHIGTAASKGYMTADQLVLLENNLVMVKTAFTTYKFMNKLNTLMNMQEIKSVYDKIAERASMKSTPNDDIKFAPELTNADLNRLETLEKIVNKVREEAKNIDFSELDSPIENDKEMMHNAVDKMIDCANKVEELKQERDKLLAQQNETEKIIQDFLSSNNN
jgi:hypothetical protein